MVQEERKLRRAQDGARRAQIEKSTGGCKKSANCKEHRMVQEGRK